MANSVTSLASRFRLRDLVRGSVSGGKTRRSRDSVVLEVRKACPERPVRTHCDAKSLVKFFRILRDHHIAIPKPCGFLLAIRLRP